jgi:hypothetical protein
MGFVLGTNPLKETVLVELESKAEVECTLNEIKILQPEPDIQGANEAAEELAVTETPVVETAAAASNESPEPEAKQSKPQDQQVNPAPPQ